MADASRDRIVEAARDLFVERGATAITMRDVAVGAGLSTMATYRHFENRAALIQAVVECGADLFMSYLHRALGAPTPWERLAMSGQQYYRFALEQPRDYAVLFMQPADEAASKRGPATWQGAATFRFLVDRVRECMDAKVLASGDAEQVALVIWAQAHGLVSLYLVGKLGLAEPQFRKTFAQSLGQMIRGFGGAKAPQENSLLSLAAS